MYPRSASKSGIVTTAATNRHRRILESNETTGNKAIGVGVIEALGPTLERMKADGNAYGFQLELNPGSPVPD
jgi:hypothetical protein